MPETFAGSFVRRGAPGYEDARTAHVFNRRMPERYPEAVLMAATEADVAAGVRLARTENLQVAVRSGGHSWAVGSVRDDTVLIDLGALNALAYDDATGVVTAGPAARGGTDLDPFLASRGRFFPVGHCDTVGLGGFLLQGGQGWQSRAYGWGCENVLAVDVVTARGETVRADAQNNSDLYWAARGAGAAFPGVVTRFHLTTFPRPAIALDLWTFPMESLRPVLRWLHDVLPRLDARVEPILVPALPPAPANAEQPDTGAERALVLVTTAAAGSNDEAFGLLAPLDSPPIQSIHHARMESSVEEATAVASAAYPEGTRWAADCSWTNAGADEVADHLSRVWTNLPTARSTAVWYGWAPTRALPDMAFSLEANVYLATYVGYSDSEYDREAADFVHSAMGEISESIGCGAYLGDTDFSRRADRFMSAASHRRLASITRSWDPDGVFVSHVAAAQTGRA